MTNGNIDEWRAYYLKEADEVRQKAEAAADPVSRAEWLRLAQKWQQLADMKSRF